MTLDLSPSSPSPSDRSGQAPSDKNAQARVAAESSSPFERDIVAASPRIAAKSAHILTPSGAGNEIVLNGAALPPRLPGVPESFVRIATDLARLQPKVEAWCKQEGLDFFPIHFHVVDDRQLHEIAAFGGFPVVPRHWRHGLEYEQLTKGYGHGLQRIYEMIINSDPCHAYMLASNSFTDHKLVMPHCYGHSDFFKNNAYFAHTNRKMLDQMGDYAVRLDKYVERYGLDQVERFWDACLSLEDLIDPHSVTIRRRPVVRTDLLTYEEEEKRLEPGKLNSRARYMDDFINPPSVLAAERERLEKESTKRESRFPEQPEQDVLLFLIENAPLQPWQRDVLTIIRDRGYYFYPQGQTKIMNEGWASYWHSTIMNKYLMEPSELIDYADHYAGGMQMGRRMNPYKIGIEIFRDIEERWNKGQFGREWEECQDAEKKRNWDKGLGLGRAKIFEVRRVHNDITFLDTFLTPELVNRFNLFSFAYDKSSKIHRVESREFDQIKRRLLDSLTNFGKPHISVHDGNFSNRGEMQLKHRFTGQELDMRYAQETLKNLQLIWNRPVHIESVMDGKPTRISFDGDSHSTKTIS